MKSITIKMFANMFNNLAHAFNSQYWNMGDTSYKEQIFISFVEGNKISKEVAYKLAYKCGFSLRKNPIMFMLINGEAEERMGMTIGLTPKIEKKLEVIRYY